MNREILLLLPLLLPALPALAGPYDQPYSIIVTDPRRAPDPLLRPVIVNRVDGENTLNNKAVVPPGKHEVVVDLPPRKGFKLPTQNTMALETEPCVRYYVSAKLNTQVTQEWTPVVRYSERIGECEAAFKIAHAPK
jgi:hypothetical protein